MDYDRTDDRQIYADDIVEPQPMLVTVTDKPTLSNIVVAAARKLSNFHESYVTSRDFRVVAINADGERVGETLLAIRPSEGE